MMSKPALLMLDEPQPRPRAAGGQAIFRTIELRATGSPSLLVEQNAPRAQVSTMATCSRWARSRSGPAEQLASDSRVIDTPWRGTPEDLRVDGAAMWQYERR